MSVRLNKGEIVEAYVHGILRGEVVEHRDNHPVEVIKPTTDLLELVGSVYFLPSSLFRKSSQGTSSISWKPGSSWDSAEGRKIFHEFVVDGEAVTVEHASTTSRVNKDIRCHAFFYWKLQQAKLDCVLFNFVLRQRGLKQGGYLSSSIGKGDPVERSLSSSSDAESEDMARSAPGSAIDEVEHSPAISSATTPDVPVSDGEMVDDSKLADIRRMARRRDVPKDVGDEMLRLADAIAELQSGLWNERQITLYYQSLFASCPAMFGAYNGQPEMHMATSEPDVIDFAVDFDSCGDRLWAGKGDTSATVHSEAEAFEITLRPVDENPPPTVKSKVPFTIKLNIGRDKLTLPEELRRIRINAEKEFSIDLQSTARHIQKVFLLLVGSDGKVHSLGSTIMLPKDLSTFFVSVEDDLIPLGQKDGLLVLVSQWISPGSTPSSSSPHEGEGKEKEKDYGVSWFSIPFSCPMPRKTGIVGGFVKKSLSFKFKFGKK